VEGVIWVFVERVLRGTEKLPWIVEKVKECVCRVVADIENVIEDCELKDALAHTSALHSLGVISMGTGFLITSRHVVTCFHVIEGASKIFAITPSGEKVRLKPVKVYEKYDLALLEPERAWCRGIDVTSMARPRIGDIVFTLGYPLLHQGVDPLLSVGFLSAVSNEDGIEKLTSNISFNIGNSGGPLLNEDGLLLGVVEAKSIVKEPLIKIIDEVMKRPGVELVYGKIAIYGLEIELTLSLAIRTLIRWIEANTQSGIGKAISSKYVSELVGGLK
jgi:S1-C subfamily serine protease